MRLYATKKVSDDIENYLMDKICCILFEKDLQKDTDYLQIFNISDNQLVVEQEQPAKKESYSLSRKYDKTKL